MGLVALLGGGAPPFASTATSTGDGTSTNPPCTLGTRAVDSSGGEYVLCRTASTGAADGTLHTINSSIGYFHAVIVPASTASSGSVLGVNHVTSGSTANYAWFQVYGASTILGASTTGGAGSRLWGSTATAGAVLGSSGGLPLVGIQTTSSNASSLWNAFLSYPTIDSPI